MKKEKEKIQEQNQVSSPQILKDETFISESTLFTKREWLMRYASPFKALMFMAGPMIIITLVNAMYGIIDKQLTLQYAINQVTELVKDGTIKGWLSNGIEISPTSSIADLTLFAKQLINVSTQYSNTIIFILQALSLLTGVGTAVRWGQAMGRRNKAEMDNVLVTGFMQTLILALIGLIILYFVAPYIICAQANVAYADRNQSIQFLLANEYTQKFIFGFPLLVTATFLSTLLRTEGKVTWVIVINVLSVLINMLSGMLIMEASAPAEKMAGAVYGSMVAWSFLIISSLLIIIFSKNTLLKPNFRKVKLKLNDAMAIWSFGFSPFLSNFILAVGNFILTLLITIMHPDPNIGITGAPGFIVIEFVAQGGQQGSVTFVGHAIRVLSAGMPWVGILFAPIIGMMQGGNANYAYNKGAGNRFRILQTLRIQMILNTAWACLVVIILAIAAGPMLALFDGPSEYRWWFFCFMCCFFFVGWTYSAMSLFQGTGLSLYASSLAIVRALVCTLSMTFFGWLIARGSWNNDGHADYILFLFYGLSEIPAAIFTTLLLWLTAKKSLNAYQMNNTKDEFAPPTFAQAALNEITISMQADAERMNRIKDDKIHKLTVEKKADWETKVAKIEQDHEASFDLKLKKSRIKREKYTIKYQFDHEVSMNVYEIPQINLRKKYNKKKYKLTFNKVPNAEKLQKLETWHQKQESKLAIKQAKIKAEVVAFEVSQKKVNPFTLLFAKTEPQPIKNYEERVGKEIIIR